MNIEKTLAAMAVTGILVGVAACGGDKTEPATQSNAAEATAASAASPTAAKPEAAKTETAKPEATPAKK